MASKIKCSNSGKGAALVVRRMEFAAQDVTGMIEVTYNPSYVTPDALFDHLKGIIDRNITVCFFSDNKTTI